jgi:hypothetical protein
VLLLPPLLVAFARVLVLVLVLLLSQPPEQGVVGVVGWGRRPP